MTEQNRGRIETRTTQVFNDLTGVSPEWSGLNSFIQVHRTVLHQDTTTEEWVYFISSLPATTSAKVFADGIRSHWAIENSLHYVKDVTFKEDASKTRTKQAPQNISLCRSMVINLFRHYGFTNLAQAIRLVANDIPRLYGMITA